MAKILVIYFSHTGNTKKMAELVRTGIREEGGVDAELKDVKNVRVEELKQADGIIVGSPTYYGSMSWHIKQLFDESVVFHGALEGKVGAAFTSSANVGGGNETTVMDILKCMLIHGMIIQGNSKGDHYGPVALRTPDERASGYCRELGRRTAVLVKKIEGGSKQAS